jgi:hypothetical protein
VIPVIEKDLVVLPYVIDAARANIRHPIGSIYIVAPDAKTIKKTCTEKGCIFIDENTVLPITKRHIDYKSKSWDRSGWLFQQLLKWSGDRICSEDHYLVIDADTVFIQPHKFYSKRNIVFYCRKNKVKEYFITYRKLMGTEAAAPHSFVTHYMLFEKSKVHELKRLIEKRHRTDWYKAIIQSINKKKSTTFSEYETYGNYMYSRYPRNIIMKDASNLNLYRSELYKLSSPKLLKELAEKYKSISFHSWYNKDE